ncbi:hypothetical protein FACS189431_3940 [Alphaproteobacteria bacterium]|nr:hypothetical protein FACS189431_3940 [Alphaproteobacteria bacterium]
MKKIVYNIIFVLALLVFLGAILFVVLLGKSTEDIYVFGYKPFVIATGSMETEYMTHSVVVIEQGHFDDVKIGDVIAFRAEAMSGKLAFHRVVREVDDTFVTKGDNNQIVDGSAVTRDNYIGREVFHTNLTAYYMQELAQPYGYIRVIALPILAIVMLCIGIYLFGRWPAERKLKHVVSSAALLGVCVIALIVYTLWDNTRVDYTNNKLGETVTEFQSQAVVGATVTVNNHEVIGAIEIPSIGVKYPIIKYENEASLNISVTQYAGPTLNTVGNVVLAGHRSANGGNLYFTKIDTLRGGDVVRITDKQGRVLDYFVDSYAIHTPDDLSVLSAENSNRRELTLISCTADLKDRYIIKLTARD